MYYEYKMVQIPPSISIKAKEAKGSEAAWYLQEIVTKYVDQGWEFHRVDTIGVVQNPGCLGSLFGASKVFFTYYVMSFKREKSGSTAINAPLKSTTPPPLPQ